MRHVTFFLVFSLMGLRLMLLSPAYDVFLKGEDQIISGQLRDEALPSNEESASAYIQDKVTPVNTQSTAIEAGGQEAETMIYDPILGESITLEIFNSYNSESLQHFKGIGVKTAEEIIAYRESQGLFASFDDLILVKGIGEKKMNELLNQENE